MQFDRVGRSVAWGALLGLLAWPFLGTAPAALIAGTGTLVVLGVLNLTERPRSVVSRSSPSPPPLDPPRVPSSERRVSSGPWREIRLIPGRVPGRLLPLLAPVVVVALFLFLGHPVPAVIVGLLFTALLVVGHFRPSVRQRLDGLANRFGTALARVVAVALLGIVMLLVVLPVHVVLWLLGRDPLDNADGWWAGRRGPVTSDEGRTFGLEPGVVARSRLRWLLVVPSLLGWLAVIAAVNYVLGVAWDRMTDDDGFRTATEAVVAGETDPRVDSPAYADSPWAGAYLEELAQVGSTYQPWALLREAPFSGRYITIDDRGVRRSFEAAGVEPDEAVTIWFFGGSTTWGEGQRDEYTVPSQVARLADAEDLPVRVVNFGVRGYTSYQEFLLFEQEVHRRPAPDLVVFYDGSNDLNVYRPEFNDPALIEAGTPPHYGLEAIGATLDNVEGATGDPGIVDRYLDHSFVHDLVDGFRDLFGDESAGAQGHSEASEALIDQAVATYQRSRSLILAVAAEAELATTFFWQPEAASALSVSEIGTAADRVGPPTIDITDALTDPPAAVYIDGGHTNERGARIVAEAMWEHLEPQVRALVADR